MVGQTEQIMPRELCTWHMLARVLGYSTQEMEAQRVIISWTLAFVYRYSRFTLCFL